MMNNCDCRRNLSNKKIAKMDLKDVFLSDLIMEYQKQNSIISKVQLERAFMTVLLKTEKELNLPRRALDAKFF